MPSSSSVAWWSAVSKFLLSLIRPKGKDDGKSEEQRYDPRCGMNKEKFEWRFHRASTVNQRMPQVLEKMDVLLKTTPPLFLDDPDGLNQWDQLEKEIRYSFEHRLNYFLASPLSIPNSDLYEQLMKRKAWSRTLIGRASVGLEKLKEASTRPPSRYRRPVRAGAIAAGVAAAFALGLAVGRGSALLHGSSKQRQRQQQTIANNATLAN